MGVELFGESFEPLPSFKNLETNQLELFHQVLVLQNFLPTMTLVQPLTTHAQDMLYHISSFHFCGPVLACISPHIKLSLPLNMGLIHPLSTTSWLNLTSTTTALSPHFH